MLGRRVSGYEVKSILGGGRRTLYLAVNPETGHRAALRTLADDDTAASFAEFAREVTAALELARNPEIVTRTLDDGREVLVALIDPAAPGTGATRFPATTRLERVPKPSRSIALPALVLAFALLLLGLGLWRRLASQPGPAAVADAPTPTPPVSAQLETVPANTPTPAPPEPEVAVPSVVEPTPKREVPPTKTPPRTAVVATREPEAACEPTDEWKKHRRADLQELDDRIQRSDTLWRQEQAHLDRVSSLILRARDPGDCREVEAELRKLVSRIIGPQ